MNDKKEIDEILNKHLKQNRLIRLPWTELGKRFYLSASGAMREYAELIIKKQDNGSIYTRKQGTESATTGSISAGQG